MTPLNDGPRPGGQIPPGFGPQVVRNNPVYGADADRECRAVNRPAVAAAAGPRLAVSRRGANQSETGKVITDWNKNKSLRFNVSVGIIKKFRPNIIFMIILWICFHGQSKYLEGRE